MKFVSIQSIFCAVLAVLAMTAQGAAMTAPGAAMTAQEILKFTDAVRNPNQPFSVINTLVEYHSGQPTAKTVLQVYAKLDPDTGQFRNLVRYVDPARDAGKSLLMNGNIMWFYDPASSATIRISPQQRLLGQASNGDVLSVNLNRDYTAKLIGEESVEDAHHAERKTWHLDLTAANEAAVYSRIEYWVEKDTYFPVKARFFTDSGRLLKVAFYSDYKSELGGKRPTLVFIVDELDSTIVTTMSFSDYEPAEIPEAWFQRAFLSHLPSR